MANMDHVVKIGFDVHTITKETLSCLHVEHPATGRPARYYYKASKLVRKSALTGRFITLDIEAPFISA